MAGKLDLRVLDYICRWRFSSRFLINHHLGKAYGANAVLFKRLLEQRKIIKIKKDNYTLFIPASATVRELAGMTGFDYPSGIKPSRLPTRSLYHDMLVQYVSNLLMDVKKEDRFKVRERFLSAAMMTDQKAESIPDAVILNDGKTSIVEVELWAKEKKRIYRRLLFSLKQAFQREAGDIVFVFRNDSHRNRYMSLLEENHWPIFNYTGNRKKLVETDQYELHDSDRELFRFVLLDELDGLTQDTRKLL